LILPILLVFLAVTGSLVAALAAFIVSRAYGQSAFTAICYAAATFTAALTLTLLVLTFVESAAQDHGPSQVPSSATISGDTPAATRTSSADLCEHDRVCTRRRRDCTDRSA
jgi:hypothetical protein